MMRGSESAFRTQRDVGNGNADLLGVNNTAEAWPDLAQRAAQSHCTILISGETGVGKGRLALWLHANSPRAKAPFIPVNCGAIPETIIDSQLFGHVKGAFTGASADHPGFIRAAETGTLFLDEVSELPISAQMRLLRLLQEREIQPVGCTRPVNVNVRIIAATNSELSACVEQQKFRQDLLYRLDVIQLRVKALRDRPDDLPVLLESFNREFAELYERPLLAFDRAALNLMRTYHWPGNIRQLRTVVERLYVLLPDENVTVSRLLDIGQLGDALADNACVSMDGIKREAVQRVVAESGGSISRAATLFGVHRSTIYRWLNGK